jgi:hypothetical protein
MKRAPLALTALLVGCFFAYKAPAPPVPRPATSVNASMGRTWDAVIDMFAARNIPIRTIERASGIIATDQLSVGSEGSAWADCGSKGSERVRPNNASYNVLVRGDSGASTVKATVRWVYSTLKDGPRECSTSHVWERGFEEEVRARAENPVVGIQAPSYSSSAPSAPPAAEPTGTASPAPAAPPSQPDSGPPARVAGDGRANSDLLTNEGFRRAVDDMKRKNLLLNFRESGAQQLDVDVSATALNEPALEYHLTRLFLAYGATLQGNSATVLRIRANGQTIAHYTRGGLRWSSGDN